MVARADCGLAQAQLSRRRAAQVSHETIYKSLYIQTRGVLKKELLEHLRAKRTIRRSRHASLKHDGLGQLKNAISISERPASVEDRAVPGHWEGDLIAGSRNSYIATLVERQSRSVMLAKVANKDTASVVSALIKQPTNCRANSTNRLHGTAEWSLPIIGASPWRLMWPSTFVIPEARGNAERTKTPTACCANTFRRAQI